MNSVLLLLSQYRYVILFPLAAFEGPIIAIFVGVLVYAHIFDFWPAYIILLFGDIVPDTFFYYIGYFGNTTKFSMKYLLRSDFFTNHLDTMKKLWTKHPQKTMFLGKLAYGMALPFLASAGAVKMPYKKFILRAIPISIFQYALFVSIGYYFGNSYVVALTYIKNAEIILAGVTFIIIIAYYIFITSLRKKLLKEV